MPPQFKRVLVGVSIGLGSLVLVTWTLIHTLHERDTLYKGRTLYDWLNLMNSPVAATSNETRVVLQTVVIPDLTATMFNDTRDPKWRIALIDELNTLPGVNIFYTPAAGRRARAAVSLGGLGSVAQAAVPDLIKAVKGSDSAVRGAAAKALGDIRCQPETVIPLLVTCLDDPQDDVPAAAADALGEFGRLSQAALPKLVSLLPKPDKDLQRAVRAALKNIDPEEAAKVGVK